jgi:L-lactate dehydrogenase complex protein LldG
MAIDDNRASRDAVLARVRAALRRDGAPDDARVAALACIAAHEQGPRPALAGDFVERFLARVTDMSSTVDRVETPEAVPAAVARYLATIDTRMVVAAPDAAPVREHADAGDVARLEDAFAGAGARDPSPSPRATSAGDHPEARAAAIPAGVCWPQFATLGWSQAGLSVESRPTVGHDALGITGCFCAIAETGTLVFLTGTETPSATFLLPETHVAIVFADQIVAGMEEAFARIRSERGALPRAVNLVSGPSRTGDIEQTIVLGAHGPRRMHVVLVSGQNEADRRDKSGQR